MRSFTLLETLITLAIAAVLMFLTISPGLNFYRSQQLGAQTQGILQTLRRAQMGAISQVQDSNFGVRFTGNNYVLFKGNSYAGRDSQYDESFNLSNVITVSGLPEIVFSKMTGKPNVTGDIIIKSGNQSRTININEVGRINYE